MNRTILIAAAAVIVTSVAAVRSFSGVTPGSEAMRPMS